MSHTFNGKGLKRIEYILTRQSNRRLVHNVTVHPQPNFLPCSDHNIVSARVRLIGRFAWNRKHRDVTQRIDRQLLETDTSLRVRLA